VDESLLHALLDSELQDLVVACLSVALDILPSWLDAELPWAFYPCLLLEAVVRCSIVAFDFFEMGAFAVLLESCDCLSWFSKVKKELNMYRAFLSLLELAVDVRST